MALLNGKYVDNQDINPEKHKFIGMFRSPSPPTSVGIIVCPCGQSLLDVGSTLVHWQSGHFDCAQYITLNEK